jgi:hypothetical protein
MLRRIAWRMQEVPDGLRANAISEAALRGVIEDFFGYDWRFDAPKRAAPRAKCSNASKSGTGY